MNIIANLPIELSCEIAKYLDPKDYLPLALVNKEGYRLSCSLPFIQIIFNDKILSKEKIVEFSEGLIWKKNAADLKKAALVLLTDPIQQATQKVGYIKKSYFQNCTDTEFGAKILALPTAILIGWMASFYFKKIQGYMDPCYMEGLSNCSMDVLKEHSISASFNSVVAFSMSLFTVAALFYIYLGLQNFEANAEHAGQSYARLKNRVKTLIDY